MKKLFAAAGGAMALGCLPLAALAEEEAASSGSTANVIAVAVLVAAMGVALYFSAKKVKWDAKMIAKAAVCVALAYVLSLITIFRMPQGGHVTLVAMLPLILFSVAFGPLEGLLVGAVYGLLQLILDPYVIHPVQLLVDYPMAYAATALACLARFVPVNRRWKLPIAVVLGYLGRYAMAVLSGVVFFAEYAGDQGALAYSLAYNISYIGPECLVCAALTLIPGMTRLPELLRRGSER